MTVCLLEAGPSDEGDERILDLRRWASLAGTELVPTFAVNAATGSNRDLLHCRAVVLGGCGSHNQCIALAPPDVDLRGWEESGAAGWGPDGTRAALARVLDRVHVEEALHENACAAAFVDAAQALGLPLATFSSRELEDGVGWLPLNARGHRRQSSSVAYLHPIRGLPDNLTIRVEATALRVLLDESGAAVGVETAAGPVYASREVILSAGAFETPKLLLLSGIGPRRELAQHGIQIRHDLPGVGENLLDHPECTLVWAASSPVPRGVAQDWEVACFARSDPALATPDVMVHFGTIPFDGAGRAAGSAAEHAIWMTPNVTRPKSVGRLSLRSAASMDPPVLDFRYFTDAEGHDARVFLAGARLARRLASTPPLSKWIAREIVPGSDIVEDAELSAYLRRHATTVHHPAGTCRMGALDDTLAVCDPQLRVRGVGRLRIADASIFPSMISVNPNLTCMMIGEICAELVLGGRRT